MCMGLATKLPSEDLCPSTLIPVHTYIIMSVRIMAVTLMFFNNFQVVVGRRELFHQAR